VNPEIEALLTKSRRSLAAAKRLFEEGDYDFAASRAYYAIFYTTEALLLSEGLRFSKHSAVIAAFGERFVKRGVFPTRLHDILIKAFTRRNLGDYKTDPFPRDDAESLLQEAQEFIEAVEGYLRREEG